MYVSNLESFLIKKDCKYILNFHTRLGSIEKKRLYIRFYIVLYVLRVR